MTLAQALLVLLNALPRHYTDKNEVGRDERLQSLSVAIAEGVQHTIEQKYFSDATVLGAAVVYLGNIESHYAYRIQAGLCRSWECDKNLAVGPWQGHRRDSWTDEYWAHYRESLTEQATVAAQTIAGNLGTCHSMAGAFGLYNTGKFCDSARYATAEKYVQIFANRIRVLLKKEN
jgi:hypothetical protein